MPKLRGKYCSDRKSNGMVIGGFQAPATDMRSTIEKPRRGLVVEAGEYRINRWRMPSRGIGRSEVRPQMLSWSACSRLTWEGFGAAL
jgi:hypothetical protein